jgi:hypothetical protein
MSSLAAPAIEDQLATEEILGDGMNPVQELSLIGVLELCEMGPFIAECVCGCALVDRHRPM